MKFCMRLFTCQTVFVPPVLWSSAVGSPGNKRWCSWWKINRETHSVKCCSEPPEAQDTYSPKFLWSLLYFSNQKENQIAHLPAFARNEEHLVMYNYGCILIIIRYDTYVELYMYIIYNDVCIYIYIHKACSIWRFTVHFTCARAWPCNKTCGRAQSSSSGSWSAVHKQAWLCWILIHSRDERFEIASRTANGPHFSNTTAFLLFNLLHASYEFWREKGWRKSSQIRVSTSAWKYIGTI